jgi:hypothetical protein
MLVGDAMASPRPHLAASTSQAVYPCFEDKKRARRQSDGGKVGE